jgi:hypothetical protein
MVRRANRLSQCRKGRLVVRTRVAIKRLDRRQDEECRDQ